MGGGIVFSKVGFNFDDAAGEALFTRFADEDLAEELAGHAAGVAGVEGAVEGVNPGWARRG
jgi:hypothetical protein